MKKLFTVFILLATTAASTQTLPNHREHVSMLLGDSTGQMSSAITQIGIFSDNYADDYYLHVGALAPANIGDKITYTLMYLGRAMDTANEINAIIHLVPACSPDGSETDLRDIRRMINQPWNTDTDESLLYEIKEADHHVGRMTGAHAHSQNNPGGFDPGTNIRTASGHTQEAWALIGRADWHINDAILQEAPIDCHP